MTSAAGRSERRQGPAAEEDLSAAASGEGGGMGTVRPGRVLLDGRHRQESQDKELYWQPTRTNPRAGLR